MNALSTDVRANLRHDPLTAPAHPAVGAGRLPTWLSFRPHVLALLLITLFGGVLRFAWIDRPPLWGDEALTYSRVAGSYRDMLRVLKSDGFGPLHYSGYWALARVFQLDPFVMRLIPSLAGALMVPAVYFLARQLVSVRTALLASLFTACSAFMLVYSGDAKMYAHFWLFCTLCMASFLWWMREGTRLSFLCWVAAGCAMVGTHAPGMVILALQPIILLTHPRLRWWKPPCYLVGLAIIVSGPVGYYQYFNKYQERTEERWSNSGITWVADYNRGRSGPEVVLYTASAYLLSWEWPKDAARPTLRPWVFQLGSGATAAMFVLFALGAMAWPARLRGADPPASNSQMHESFPVPWFHRSLWLGAWLIVPTYAFYCVSVHQPTSPLEWWDSGFAWVGASGWVLLGEGVALAALCSFIRPLRGVLILALVGSAGFALKLVVLKSGFGDVYNTLAGWGGGLLDDNIVRAALPVVAALAWVWSGDRTSRRAWTFLQLVCVVALLWVICYGVFAISLSTDAKDVRMPRYLGVIWPAVAITVACLLRRLPTVGLRWPAVVLVLGANLFNGAMRVWANNEAPFDRMAVDVRESESARTFTRTYIHYGVGGAGPGQGDLFTHQGRYYLCVAFLRDLAPDDFRNGGTEKFFNIRRLKDDAIKRDLNDSPKIDRVITWDRLDAKNPDHRDRLLPRLRPDGWTISDEELFVVRDHWDWRENGIARRRVYELSTSITSQTRE